MVTVVDKSKLRNVARYIYSYFLLLHITFQECLFQTIPLETIYLSIGKAMLSFYDFDFRFLNALKNAKILFFHSSRSFEGEFLLSILFYHRLHVPSIKRNHHGILDILISVHFLGFLTKCVEKRAELRLDSDVGLVISRSLVQFQALALWSVLGQDNLFHIASVYTAAKMGTYH